MPLLLDTGASVCNNSGNQKHKPRVRIFKEEHHRIMSENETAIGNDASAETAVDTNEAATSEVSTQTAGAAESNESAAPAVTEEISYHAVEKDGVVTAIWEMQGRKHVRTIDPRSRQGQDILRLYTTEHHDETAPAAASEAASS
jgi:hypothetical protein